MGYEIPDVRCEMPDNGYEMWDMRCEMPDVGCEKTVDKGRRFSKIPLYPIPLNPNPVAPISILF